MSLPLILWDIEADLRALIDKREELEESTCFTPEEDRERLAQIADCDLAIHAWVEKEIRKVDGVRGLWKQALFIIEAATREAKVQKERAERWDRLLTRLKGMCVSVMDAGGLKKLEGRTGSLSLRNNGGRQAVLVNDPTLVPGEFQDVTLTMPARMWADLCPLLQREDRERIRESMPVPRLERIREALESKCPVCDGGKSLAFQTVPCTVCGGSGFNGVPGCSLQERGVHVECR